jgi:hypothetical protein
MKPEEIARVCHEANRAATRIIGDVPVQPEWDAAPEDMKISSIRGVARVLSDPKITSAQLHWEWAREKKQDGWSWGPERDPVKKTHPALIAYEELPEAVKKKDALFRAIIIALG